jgi:DNA-binding transcriptional ArsR family regulator
MVRFVFSVEDLALTRLAISPMWELVRSVLALRDPAHAALHLPWLRSLSGRLHGLELERVAALNPPRGYTPDFLVPLPSGPLADIADDLAALRATPIAHIRADMALFASQHKRGAEIAAPYLAHPRREVRRLADALEGHWERAIEPVWPRIRAILEADITYRARRLTTGGPAALFAELNPAVRWKQPHLDVQVAAHNATFNLAGRGLLLVPSAFGTHPVVSDRAPWLPGVIYPARGIATLWERAPAAPGGLARLIGGSRAAMLIDLAAPRSTTELARRLSLSPATTSHHLAALREAGLVSGRRDGRSVLYARTSLGDALSSGGSALGPSG